MGSPGQAPPPRNAEILRTYLRVATLGTCIALPGQLWVQSRADGFALAGAKILVSAVLLLVTLTVVNGLVARGRHRLAARVVVGLLFLTCAAAPFFASTRALGDAGLVMSEVIIIAPVMVAALLLDPREAVFTALGALLTTLAVPLWAPPEDPDLRWVPALTLLVLTQFPLVEAWAHRRDIRELEAAQGRLLAQDRLGTVGLMAAAVAHDLRNPLAVIQANAELLGHGLSEADRVESVADLLDATRRMNLLVADLGRYARADDGSQGSASAPAAAARAATRLATPSLRGVRVGQDGLESLPHVDIPDLRLVQALTNLLVNAAFAVRNTSEPRIWIDGAVVPGAVELAVNDNGPGVPDELAERVFEAQFSTKGPDDGSGLGLYVCRTLLEARGGSIRVERSAEGGARFVMRLPLEGAAG